MADYNTGPMPGTDLRYEDFEAFLASFALTFEAGPRATSVRCLAIVRTDLPSPLQSLVSKPEP